MGHRQLLCGILGSIAATHYVYARSQSLFTTLNGFSGKFPLDSAPVCLTDELQQYTYTLVMFGASWDAASCRFVPHLRNLSNFYNREGRKHVAVLYVSCDNRQTQYDQYMAKLPDTWLTVPFEPAGKELGVATELKLFCNCWDGNADIGNLSAFAEERGRLPVPQLFIFDKHGGSIAIEEGTMRAVRGQAEALARGNLRRRDFIRG
eukprot:NODE_3221_length_925_cov_91.419799_g3200_i0.p1 GENE.NODE_3221_length_925_cov_91.419799_g3200_i0~~NODE_3221_length_925_cov_91.419799_g3200_i0.p1  ORF type:complete len:206 (+),score=16.38 NODE_3221_length_925_cov_91.419799_g3200_i0:53-670(+)